MGSNENCHLFCPPVRVPRFGVSWRETLTHLLGIVLLWRERAEQRRSLAGLDERLLKDIGIGQADAYRESSKWFWQD